MWILFFLKFSFLGVNQLNFTLYYETEPIIIDINLTDSSEHVRTKVRIC